MAIVTLTLGPEVVADMRGIAGLLIDVTQNSAADVDALSDEVVENLQSASAGTLLALGDLSVALMLLSQREIGNRGGAEAVAALAVDAGEAVWPDAAPST